MTSTRTSPTRRFRASRVRAGAHARGAAQTLPNYAPWRVKKTYETRVFLFVLEIRTQGSADQEIAEYANGALTKEHVYGTYVDENIATVGADGSKQYRVMDRRYSTTALLDATGVVLERYVYDAYGKATALNAAGVATGAAPMTEILWTGRRLDGETGMYYFRARYFSTSLGRFISRDIDYLDGANLYEGYFAERGGMDWSGMADYFSDDVPNIYYTIGFEGGPRLETDEMAGTGVEPPDAMGAVAGGLADLIGWKITGYRSRAGELFYETTGDAIQNRTSDAVGGRALRAAHRRTTITSIFYAEKDERIDDGWKEVRMVPLSATNKCLCHVFHRHKITNAAATKQWSVDGPISTVPTSELGGMFAGVGFVIDNVGLKALPEKVKKILDLAKGGGKLNDILTQVSGGQPALDANRMRESFMGPYNEHIEIRDDGCN